MHSAVGISATRGTKNFFISYNNRDSAWAEWIAWQLEEHGYSLVIQAWDFQAGGNFVLEVDRALKEAEKVVAVLSPHYFDSSFTASEWAAKFIQDPSGTRCAVVPIRVQELSLDGLLSSITYIDLVGKDETAARAELLAKVRQGRAKPRLG
jgi:hypothetical protein